MKMKNKNGQEVYFNAATKAGRTVYVIKALSGQSILDRDRRPHKSRTFTQLAQAERWLKKAGYHA